MFTQYFGQYLLQRGVLTGEQLREVLEAQKETRVKLGVLALNQGLMTPEQVLQVHQEQTRRDKRFGEIAVELQYVTEAQVEQLLSAQKSDHLVLGQALIDREWLSYESFSELLQAYKRDHSLTDEQFSSILKGDVESLISAILLKQNAAELSDFVSLFAKNVIRFVDSIIRMEIMEAGQQSSYERVFLQTMHREGNSHAAVTAIAGTEPSLIRLASRYAQELIDSADEMMEASVGEFLNLHNGIFLVNMSNAGVELTMLPQQSLLGDAANAKLSDYTMTVVRVYGTDFEFDLLVSDLSKLLHT
jgi:hypothetical protein